MSVAQVPLRLQAAELLPPPARKTRGIGALLTVLPDASLRIGATAPPPALRDWLAGFTGSLTAAKTAKALRLRLEKSA